MIKDDQGGTKNPYKCMNVMKQDAMDDKIIERCKTCGKQCMQEGLRQIEKLLSCYQVEANLNGSRIYWPDRKFLDGLRNCRDSIKKKSRNLKGLRLH